MLLHFSLSLWLRFKIQVRAACCICSHQSLSTMNSKKWRHKLCCVSEQKSGRVLRSGIFRLVASQNKTCQGRVGAQWHTCFRWRRAGLRREIQSAAVLCSRVASRPFCKRPCRTLSRGQFGRICEEQLAHGRMDRIAATATTTTSSHCRGRRFQYCARYDTILLSYFHYPTVVIT